MKTHFKKILLSIALVFGISLAANALTPAPALAASPFAECSGSFLGLVPWCDGLTEINNEQDVINTVIRIAINVFVDITVIASYLVLGYIIYGGYLYIFASGDPNKVAAGKKTLTHAFIGFAIVILAHIILNTIRIALMGASGAFDNCIDTECVNATELVTNVIQWVIGVSGLVATVFVVIGGIGYITSSGEPNKLQKSKATILYSLIGLAIVLLAEIITAFVSNLIQNTN